MYVRQREPTSLRIGHFGLLAVTRGCFDLAQVKDHGAAPGQGGSEPDVAIAYTFLEGGRLIL